jgi:hypothetical protein
MPTRVKLPDGSIAEFPDGMNPQDIQGAIEQHVASQPKPQQGFFSSALDSSGLSSLPALGHAMMHPLDTAAAIPSMVKGAVQEKIQQGQQLVSDYKQGGLTQVRNNGDARMIPVIGPIAEKMVQQGNAGNYAGAAGTVAGLIAPAAINKIPALQSISGAIGDAVRSPLTKGVDEVIPGTSITPRARFNAAKGLGVNLDLADATNSPIANVAKSVGRDSLAGAHVYDKAKAANISALGTSTDEALTGMSPLDREAGGVRLQDLLKANQQKLKTLSDDGHSLIQQQYGDIPLSNPETIRSTAKAIQGEQAQHASEFPSLIPGKTTSVVSDAANLGVTPLSLPKMSGLLDESGNPIPSSIPVRQPTAPTVGTGLRARSGILDLYQNNPDLVKGAADAQLQRLVGATHDAVMSSLPEPAQNALRNAQLSFKEMKQVYDNPASPYYDAIRTTSPSSKVSGIGPETPEFVRDVIGRVGSEGQGIIQRGKAEKLLGTAPGTEEYNFRSFPTQLSRMPAEYGQELFGSQLSKLGDISSTSQALARDLNPSGTAKQGQKLAEAASLIPTAGTPLLQYPLAKAMNSPSLVNWVMDQPNRSLQTVGLPAASRLPLPFIPSLVRRQNGTQ